MGFFDKINNNMTVSTSDPLESKPWRICVG